MATYSVTTTVRRETALTAIVARLNARRAAADPPRAAITNEQYLQRRIADVLDSYVQGEERRTEIASLTAAKRAALGLAAPEDDPNDLGPA